MYVRELSVLNSRFSVFCVISRLSKKPLLQPKQQLDAVAFGDTHMVGLQVLRRELDDVSHGAFFLAVLIVI
jgi:hypothetical protein